MKITQIERIGVLLKILRVEKLTSNELHQQLSQTFQNISLRQLQRDLKDVSYLLRNDEHLDRTKENKKVFYSIIQKEKDAITSILAPKIVSTEFYTLLKSSKNINLIEELHLAIENQKVISILEIKNDVTGDNSHFETNPFIFYPVQLIEHHDTYYIGGWNPKRKSAQIFEINQLEKIAITTKKFKFAIAKEAFLKEYSNRFGVTKNINSKVYDIQIQMPKIVADFIQKNHWHPSQRFTKKGNQIIMHLHCGINRELMNWLLMWLYNIRVVGPPEFVKYYQKTIQEIQKNSLETSPMIYRNTFEEKETF